MEWQSLHQNKNVIWAAAQDAHSHAEEAQYLFNDEAGV